MHEYDKEDKIETAICEIKRVAEKIGKTPTILEYKRNNPVIGYYSIIRLFGSWNNAIEQANLEINPTQIPPRNDIPKERIISELIRVSNLLGEFPSHPRFSAHSEISRGPVERFFGSWKKAKEYIAERHSSELKFKIEFKHSQGKNILNIDDSEILSRINCPFKKIPSNEMETIILFAFLSQSMGYKILNAQVQYPDLLVEKNGEIFKMEAEYLSSNYLSHGHPLNEDTICLCWRKDKEINGVQIIDLETVVRNMIKDILNK